MLKFNIWFPVFLLSAFLLAGALLLSAPSAEAQSTINGSLKGWAWSSTIGWVKLKKDTTNGDLAATPEYGVQIVNNNLSGYGWSNNFGWLRFDPTFIGPDGQSGAKIIGNGIFGWARACSVFAAGCSGTLKDNAYRGDWDGWLNLGGTSLPNAGVTKVGNALSGFAWGHLILSWLNFNLATIDNTTFSATCSISPTSPTANQPIYFTINAVNGTAPYLFYPKIVKVNADGSDGATWFEAESQQFVQNGPSLTFSNDPNDPGGYPEINPQVSILTPGNYRFYATVYDSNNNNGNATCGLGLSYTVGGGGDYTLTVNVVGNGSVTSSPAGINCGANSTCAKDYTDGQVVDLTPTGATFVGWTGPCTNLPGNICRVTMDDDRTVIADFGGVGQTELFDVEICTNGVCYDDMNINGQCTAGGLPKNCGGMVVNYQTQNLDNPHDSTRVTVKVVDKRTGVLPPLPVTFNLKFTRLALKTPNDQEPELYVGSSKATYVGDGQYSFTLNTGQETPLFMKFNDDGEDTPNIVSPYAGNYQMLLGGTAAGSRAVPTRVNFSYIDLRERED